MAAQHLPRYQCGLTVDKRRTCSNEGRGVRLLQLTALNFVQCFVRLYSKQTIGESQVYILRIYNMYV